VYLYPESSMFRGGLFVEIFAFDLPVRCWAIPDAAVEGCFCFLNGMLVCGSLDPWVLGLVHCPLSLTARPSAGSCNEIQISYPNRKTTLELIFFFGARELDVYLIIMRFYSLF
jgi:hypothetical protein